MAFSEQTRVGATLAFGVVLLAATASSAPARATAGPAGRPEKQLILSPCSTPETVAELLCGTYLVFEDRARQKGRKLALNVAVLPARTKNPEADPIFWIAGGPGDAASRYAPYYDNTWLHERRDLVMIDQRGTGESNPLVCDDLPGSAANPQGYLAPTFKKRGPIRRCREQLRKQADLTMYSTPMAMDDLNEIREALGYDQINIYGSSYGSRAALIYARRHPDTVRTLLINGIAPISYTAPLYHARGAQRALDLLFAECAEAADCSAAYPGVAEEFEAVLNRLTSHPETVTIDNPDTGEPVQVVLNGPTFADAIRQLMYSSARSRWVPFLVHLAFQGDATSFADFLANRNRSIRKAAMGMLLSVTCPEDVARIDPSEIGPETEGTFLGDARVRQQRKACRVWPGAALPDGFDDPIESDAPALMWSGQTDPVTPPEWGERAAQYLPNSLHVVVPGAHSSLVLLDDGCYRKISERFLARGSVRGLKTKCADRIELPAWEIH